MANATEASRAGIIARDDLCKLLDLSPQRVNQLVKSGHIPRVGRDTYPLVPAVRGYIAFLREDGRRTAKSAAASRLHDVRADTLTLQAGKMAGRLIEYTEAEAMFDETAGRFVAAIESIPGRAALKDIAQRRKLEQVVAAVRTELADFHASQAEQLRAIGPAGRDAGDGEG